MADDENCLSEAEPTQIALDPLYSASWANIAAEAGYYDQAHLIAEFRAISGVTPSALLGELRGAVSVG